MKNRLGDVLNVLVILSVLVFLASENGPIRSYLRDRSESKKMLADINGSWSALTDVGGRIGNPDSQPDIVEFIDYQCPPCRDLGLSIEDVLVADPSLSVVVRQLPGKVIHPRAEEAALAVICAEFQGEFAPLHEYLISSEDWYEMLDWEAIASSSGVTQATALVACMDSNEARERLDADRTLAAQLRVRMTPTLITQKGVRPGAATSEEIGRLVAR